MGARRIALWVLLTAFLAAPARAEDPEARYQAVREAYLSLKSDIERQRFRHNHLRIIDDFERFVADHPKHARAPDALYNAGRLAWDLYLISRVPGDLARAQSLFVRLSDGHPESSLADDALFLRGRILLEHGGEPSEAYRAFDGVASRFPKGDMAPKAREMLGRLAAHKPPEPPPPPPPEPRPAAPAAPEAPAAAPDRVFARTTGWSGNASGSQATITEVKTWSNEDFTRVAVYLTEPVQFREGEVPADASLGLPRRIYVDLKPARLSPEAAQPVPVGDGLLKQVRTGQFSPDTVRVVLDVATVRNARIFPMEGSHRLVIDVTGTGRPPAVAEAGAGPTPGGLKTVAATASEPSEPDAAGVERVLERLSKTQSVPLSVQAGLKIRRVVLDAGHGGHDSGAVGKGGTLEKDVALVIAKLVGERLEAQGLEVLYTRTDDTFIPLEERTAIANTRGADLFVSIHANAHTRRDRRGVTTYYLDISNDRYGIRLAALENATTERSVSDLQFILADLAKKSNTDESARLARRVQEKLVGNLRKGYTGVRDLGVNYALFYVLLGAKMPSILVETSFISNPMEEKRLRSSKYRERLADGIAEGIRVFMEDRNKVALGGR